MSTEQLPPHVMVTRFYTAVRRIPTLVGKLPNGGFIPGGPYTLGQVALLLLVAVGGFYTMPWWGGRSANLGNFIKLALAIALTSMLSSKIRWRGRQVLPALRGAASSYTRGSQPRQGGRTPTARSPRRLRSDILLVEEWPPPAAARADVPAAQAASDSSRRPQPRAQLQARPQSLSQLPQPAHAGLSSRASRSLRPPTVLAAASPHRLQPTPLVDTPRDDLAAAGGGR